MIAPPPVTYTREQVAYIVYHLAHCMAPEILAANFRQRYKGVNCETHDIGKYSPSRLKGEWREYFDQERALWLEAPLTDRRVRKAFSASMAQSLASNNQHEKALKYLDLLAKEDADYFASKSAKPDDGKPSGPMSFTFNLDKANAKPD